MNDFRLFAKCDTCRQKRLYIAKRQVPLPLGNLTATSKKLMCRLCYKKVLAMLKTNHVKDNS